MVWIKTSVDVNANKTAKQRSQLHQVIEQIFEIVGEISGKKLSLIKATGEHDPAIRIEGENEDGLPLHLISQGYNNVIGWVGFFMKRLWESTPDDKKHDFKNSFATCLIDEIDTYLHPKWQRTVLATLAKHFPNTQFIVTTHSPLVASSVPNMLVYQVFLNGEIRREEHIEGLDANSVLANSFDVPLYTKEYSDKLDNFYEFVRLNDIENAQTILTELEGKWGSENKEIQRMTMFLDDIL